MLSATVNGVNHPETGKGIGKDDGSETEREVSQGNQGRAPEGAGPRELDGGAAAGKDRAEHGAGRSDAELEDAGPAGRRSGGDCRAKAGDHAGEEVDCGVQGAR